jgi:hypothetical protein
MVDDREWRAMAATRTRVFGTISGRRMSTDRRLMLAGLVILMVVAVVAVGWSLERGTPAARGQAAGSTASRSAEAVSGGAVFSSPAAPAGAANLRWHIIKAYTARKIVNAYLPPTTASGVYLIIDVATTNKSSRPVILSGNHVSLDLAGARYPVDSAAVSALELAGHRGLPGNGVDPLATTSGWVVFDVPRHAVSSTPQLCVDGPVPGGAAAAVCRG